MADRTVNININYKVNTAEVQKAAAASAAADKATQSLNKAIRDYGVTAKKSTDDAAKGLKNVSDATKKAATDTSSLASQFNAVYTAAKSFLAIQLAKEVIGVSLEMSKLAGNIESVSRAFRNQIPNSVTLLNQLRKATQGTVTDFDLMQKSLQALNFGIDVQQLPKLLEFAQVRAQQTGVSVDYLVNSIVTGIGRKSILVLDNLGISANRLKEEFDGASIKSQSVGDVTAAVSRIAAQELAKMGGAIETAATKTDQLNVSWERLRVTVSKFFENGKVVDFLKSYVDTFQTFIEATQKGVSVSELSAQRLREESAAISDNQFAVSALTGSKKENIQILEDEIQRLTKGIGSYTRFRDSQLEVIDSLKSERSELQELRKSGQLDYQSGVTKLRQIGEQIALRERLIEANKEGVLVDQELVKLLQARLIALQKVNKEEADPTGIIERKKQQIQDLQDAIEKTNNLADLGPGGLLISQLEIAQAELADLQQAFIDFTKIPKAILDYQAEIKKNVKSNDIHNANEQFAQEFFNIDEVTKRVEANIKAIADGLLKIPAAKAGIVDLRSDLQKLFDDEGTQSLFTNTGIDIFAGQLQSLASVEADSFAARINNLQSFYKEQQVLSGDNEKQKDILRIQEDRKIKELRRQQFQAEQRAQIASVVINTAASIAKTAANLGFPAAIPFIIVAAAEGAAQIAIIKRQQSNFAKGVLNLKGPGTETSDSIPANLSKGESVMTARETRESGNILKAIRDNRLNDKLLQNLHLTKEGVKVVGMSDERIVKAINANKPPDIIRIGNQIYEARKSQDGVSTRIRRKAMG